jgi:hypothetical protein
MSQIKVKLVNKYGKDITFAYSGGYTYVRKDQTIEPFINPGKCRAYCGQDLSSNRIWEGEVTSPQTINLG